MKYIIFSDVHSNLEAIEAFCGVLKSINYDKMVCLGDIVGYNADPNLVVEWIRDEVDLVLAGNHDYAVLNKTDVSYIFFICQKTKLKCHNYLTLLCLPEEGKDTPYFVMILFNVLFV